MGLISKFPQQLAEAIKQRGITQRQLSVYLGVTQPTVNRWLKNINEPDLGTLLKICIILDETPNDMLGYSEDF